MMEQLINSITQVLGADTLEFWKGFIIAVILYARFVFFQRNAWVLLLLGMAALAAIYTGILHLDKIFELTKEVGMVIL